MLAWLVLHTKHYSVIRGHRSDTQADQTITKVGNKPNSLLRLSKPRWLKVILRVTTTPSCHRKTNCTMTVEAEGQRWSRKWVCRQFAYNVADHVCLSFFFSVKEPCSQIYIYICYYWQSQLTESDRVKVLHIYLKHAAFPNPPNSPKRNWSVLKPKQDAVFIQQKPVWRTCVYWDSLTG